MDTKPHLDLIRQLRTVLANLTFLTNRYKHEKKQGDTKSVSTLEELYKEIEWYYSLRDQYCKLPKIIDITKVSDIKFDDEIDIAMKKLEAK